MYTQFMFNKLAFNPGFAGSFESPTITAMYRNQWMGFDGSPKTAALSYSQRIKPLDYKVGLGANLVSNSIGINHTITLDAAYSYRVEFKRGTLSVGLQVSVRNFYQNWSDPRLVASQPISTDGAIPAGIKSKLLPNFGFGMYYTGFKGNKEKWYAGIAAPRMVSNNIDFADDGSVLTHEAQHFNAMGGIHFFLSKEATITPQILLKYVKNAPFDVDLNVNLMLYEKFLGGITYRSGGDTKGLGESVDVLLGMQVTDKLFFCMSYDIGLTQLSKYNNGSIEAVARWYFNPPSTGSQTKPNL
jgi:type IX secretion system PorP/SprF family membrane protein